MNLIEHFVNGKIIPGSSDKKGKVFNPATGVNRISVGSITHSAPAVDFKLEIN